MKRFLDSIKGHRTYLVSAFVCITTTIKFLVLPEKLFAESLMEFAGFIATVLGVSVVGKVDKIELNKKAK